jgi:hypothetical protein
MSELDLFDTDDQAKMRERAELYWLETDHQRCEAVVFFMSAVGRMKPECRSGFAVAVKDHEGYGRLRRHLPETAARLDQQMALCAA